MTQSLAPPTLELRIPISPRDSDMRMVRYLLESIQLFGGPIARAAHCVLSISAERPEFDLRSQFPWMDRYSISVRWLDPEVFEAWQYEATGFDRFWVKSDADVIATLDSDLLIAQDFDDIVLRAHQTQVMLGFIAHVSPFGLKYFDGLSGDDMWNRIYEAAHLDPPDLCHEYTGWGLDFAEMFNAPDIPIISNHPEHRFGPAYFNAGVVFAPRTFFDKMGDTFVETLELVRSMKDTIFNWQVAHTVELDRHKLPRDVISINDNFPMNLPSDQIRSVNPDPDGRNQNEDIRIFHYIGQRGLFDSPAAIEQMIEGGPETGAWPAFRKTLRAVHEKVLKDDTGL